MCKNPHKGRILSTVIKITTIAPIYIYTYIYMYFVFLSSSIESMDYYLLFNGRSWNNDMRCMSRHILMV